MKSAQQSSKSLPRNVRTTLTSAAQASVQSRDPSRDSVRERGRAAENHAERLKPEVLRRIALMLPELGLRGSVQHMLTLAKLLRERGHRVLMVDPGGALEQSAQALCALDVERVTWRPAARGGRVRLSSRRKMIRALQEFAPDVLHVGTLASLTPWRDAAKRIKCPLIATLHSARHAKKIDPAEFAAFDRIVAISHDAREAVVNHGRVLREQVDLVFPGVQCVPKDALTERFKSRSQNIPVISWIGPLNEKAGLRTLLKAANLLSSSGVEYRMLIAGQGVHVEFVREWISRYNLGYQVIMVNELYSYMGVFELADIAVSTSDLNDQTQFVLEAMARGITPVLSGSGGNYELVEDGVNGLIFKEGDPEALADAVARASISAELRKNLGVAAWEKVRNERSALAMTSEYESVYERALLYR